MNSTTVLPKKTEMANSKDVVVTGVATGIGWGTTKVLVSKGFRVFGSVRKQADADRLQIEFPPLTALAPPSRTAIRKACLESARLFKNGG